METKDMKLCASSGFDPESDKGEEAKIVYDPCHNKVEGDGLNCGKLQQNGCDAEIEEGQLIPETVMDKVAADNSAMLLVSGDFTEPIMTVNEEQTCADELASNGYSTIQSEIAIGTHHIDGNTKSGVKRSCIEEHQSSVHVKYYDLPRDSKRKLQELLQQWSEWHERYCSSSYETAGVLESGEETYFPALHVGLDKKSAVSFWMDNQMRKPEDNNLIPVDDDCVPLYDRGFSLGLASMDGRGNLEGGLEVVDASRCFNCGSYSHALKECPKPRDNVAVNNARKLLKTKRNQNAGSRNAARYYQSSPGGKFEGLRPGVLDPETRQLLGLGELDPPPWLQRMREIGYPPGYLDPDEEDQPSGITIYADEEEGDHEDGEILESNDTEPRKKMSVKFPGVNAPIPENADEWRWEARISKSDPFWDPLQDRENDKPDSSHRRRFQETRSPRDFKNVGPTGSESSSYPPRYGGNDISYASNSSRGSLRRPRSPSSGRSSSDRERERQRDRDRDRNRDRDSRSAREDSPSFGLYSSFSYPSPSRNDYSLRSRDHHRSRR